MIILLAIVLIASGIFAYFYFFGPKAISWDKTYSDIEDGIVTPVKVKLKVSLIEGEDPTKVKFNSTCGEITQNELEVVWDLTKEKGKTCTITATYKKDRIKIKLEVIKDFTADLGSGYEIVLSDNDDTDNDGLTNKEEKEKGTNPELSDTDLDGLPDYYELNVSKTDPLKKDTDGDTVSDYDEVLLELDPLKTDSKGDGVNDSQRTLTYNYKNENLEINLTGKGNLAGLSANIIDDTAISKKNGLINKLYSIHSNAKLDKIEMTISYTDEELTKYNIKEENLTIYYYNVEKGTYEPVESKVDKNSKRVTANLEHFSMYVVGDKDEVKESNTTEVLFVLDNSWSMYSNAQYKEITGEEYTGSWWDTLFGGTATPLSASDTEGRRFDLTKELSKKFIDKGYSVGVSEFRADYASLVGIGQDYKTISDKVSAMNGTFITRSAGTDISEAIEKSIKEFNSDTDNKIVILLTDGEDSSLKYDKKSLINKATLNRAKVCAVGFGEGSKNEDLKEISEETGCEFYSSSDVSGLDETLQKVETAVNDGLVDIDGDGIYEGLLVADSGFTASRDGFSFHNYTTDVSGGHCHGMALFAELYYVKKLPMSLASREIETSAATRFVNKDNPYGTTAPEYKLTNSHLTSYKNLYDYKLTSNILKYAVGSAAFGEEEQNRWDPKPVDRVLQLSNDYRDTMINSGIYKIETKSISSRPNYDEYEVYKLLESKLSETNQITQDEKELFKSIYHMHSQQMNKYKEVLSSGNSFEVVKRDILNINDVTMKNGIYFTGALINRLRAKDPVVIGGNYSGENHAVNAISMIQDINDNNKYFIAVYDSNHPGAKRYLTMVCNTKKSSCATEANDYYTETGSVIRMSESLEKDLKNLGL